MGGFFLATADPLEALAKNIPGTPGDDYPIFAQVPPTSFFCSGLTPGGYYADPATDCQGTIHILRNHFQGLKMVENVQMSKMFRKCQNNGLIMSNKVSKSDESWSKMSKLSKNVQNY